MTLLSYNEFERAIQSGEVKDITPYLDRRAQTHGPYRTYLAKNGLFVDELTKLEDVSTICTLIDNGYAQEYYPKWKKHTSHHVRDSLASAGWYPEEFLRDGDRMVRANVLKKHPEYAFRLLDGTNYEFDAAKKVILNMAYITLELLEIFVRKADGRLEASYEEACQLKLAGLSVEPTVLERTMNARDLHQVGNVLWTRNFSIHQILVYTLAADKYNRPGTQEAFYALFDDFASAKGMIDCTYMMEMHIGKQRTR